MDEFVITAVGRCTQTTKGVNAGPDNTRFTCAKRTVSSDYWSFETNIPQITGQVPDAWSSTYWLLTKHWKWGSMRGSMASCAWMWCSASFSENQSIYSCWSYRDYKFHPGITSSQQHYHARSGPATQNNIFTLKSLHETLQLLSLTRSCHGQVAHPLIQWGSCLLC